MSRTLAALVSARPNHASRVKDAFDDLNRYAASPKHGATLEQIKAVRQVRKAHPPQKGTVAEDDLVSRLINDPDHHDLWFNQLLGNPFCKEMGTTGPNDSGAAAFLKGFQAYMVQDYIYIAQGIFYQTERAVKATTTEEFDETAEKASHYCKHAQDALHLCVDPVDKGLGLKGIDVLQAQPADATNYYTGLQFEAAKTQNWVMGLVAMIPCVQSYYALAHPLYEKATDDVKQTLWYKLWIEPNGNLTTDEAGVTTQISFFTANYDLWKDHYAEAKEIFQKACKGEIELYKWATDSKQ